jgi:ubiquitin-like protein ATG12
MTTTPDIATVRPSDLPGASSSSAPGIPAAWRASAANQEFTSALDALEEYRKKDATKSALSQGLHSRRANNSAVVVRFKAVGNAPIMKQNFYKITASNRFQAVIQFLRKELGWKATDPLVEISTPQR